MNINTFGNTDNGKLFVTFFAFAPALMTAFWLKYQDSARCLRRVTRPRGRLSPRLCGAGSSLKQPTVPRSNWLLPKISHWRPRSFRLLPKIAHWAISKRSAPLRPVLLPGHYGQAIEYQHDSLVHNNKN